VKASESFWYIILFGRFLQTNSVMLFILVSETAVFRYCLLSYLATITMGCHL
jgi:hypothetical protein